MANVLTIKQVMAAFKTSDMTVYTWRLGTKTRDPLPHHVSSAGRVTFKEPEVKAWAKQYGLTYDALAANVEGAVPAKRGPKVTAAPEVKAAAKKVVAKKVVAKKTAVKKVPSTKLGKTKARANQPAA